MGYFSDIAVDLYEAGFNAAARSQARASCPYPEGSAERPYWMEGYDDFEKVVVRGYTD